MQGLIDDIVCETAVFQQMNGNYKIMKSMMKSMYHELNTGRCVLISDDPNDHDHIIKDESGEV